MVASTIGLFTCPRSRPHSFKVPEVRRGRLPREMRENSRGKFDWQLAIHQVAVRVRSRKGRVHMTQTMRSIKLIGAKYAANGTRDLLPTSSCLKSLVFFRQHATYPSDLNRVCCLVNHFWISINAIF